MLMTLYKEGDFASFQELYRRYSGKMYGYLRTKLPSAEVEDVFQNIFFKLHEHKEKFKQGLPFAPWFFTIAHHAVVDAHRKRKQDEASIDVDDLSSAKESLLDIGEMGQVTAALESISSDYRQVIQMRYFESRPFEEIASTLSLSPTNVRQKLSRGLKKLRGIFKGGANET